MTHRFVTRRRGVRAATFLLGLALFGLCGCGDNTGSEYVVTGTGNRPGPRVNTLVVLDSTPDAAFQAAGDPDPVSEVEAFALDSSGQVIYGPIEEEYDGEMTFRGFPDETAEILLKYNRGQGYTLATYRQGIDFVEDDDGVIVLNDVALSALSAQDHNTFTVRIANTSDYPDDQVYVAVLGKNEAKTAFYYLSFGPADVNTSQLFGPVSDYARYSQKLSALKKEADHTYSFQCPYDNLVSGRIYLSFGKQLQGIGLNTPSDPLSLQLPSATGAPDYQTVFEFMELSATQPGTGPSNTTLYANTSVVDFFSLGLGMTLEYNQGGKNLSSKVGFVDGARDKILAEFEKPSTPVEFRNYIRRDGAQTILRVLSPVQQTALQPNGALAHFLDPAIDAAWAHYSQVVLNILDNLPGHTPYGYTWTGQLISNGILSMTCTSKPAGDSTTPIGEVDNLPKPTTRIVFDCDDSGPVTQPDKDSYRNAGSDGHKRLVSLIGAALNRGVFETYSDWSDAGKFYTRADGKYNWYSKIMHLFALNGKVYGFGYDDVYGQDPTLAQPMDDVNQVIITIPPFPVL